jgi:hypothetical protein
MTGDTELPHAVEYLTGVAFPTDGPKRLLVVDRSKIEVTAWRKFNTADVYLGTRQPIVYTMAYKNLLRLVQAALTAVAEFDRPTVDLDAELLRQLEKRAQ